MGQLLGMKGGSIIYKLTGIKKKHFLKIAYIPMHALVS